MNHLAVTDSLGAGKSGRFFRLHKWLPAHAGPSGSDPWPGAWCPAQRLAAPLRPAGWSSSVVLQAGGAPRSPHPARAPAAASGTALPSHWPALEEDERGSLFASDAALTLRGREHVSAGAGSQNQGLPGADRLLELQVQDADNES